MNGNDERTFDLETRAEPPEAPVERRTPVARDDASGRRARRRRPAEEPAPVVERADLPWPLAPGLLVFLGAVLVAAAWLGYQNPYAPAAGDLKVWPWELFRSNLAQGGSPVFRWDAAGAIAFGGAVLAVTYLVLALLRPSRGRTIALLATAGAGIALFWRDVASAAGAGGIPGWATPVAAALLAGAVVRRDGRQASHGSRWLVFALLLLLAGLLFFPLPQTAGYDARALDLAAPFQELANGTRAIGTDRIWSTDGIFVIGLAALLVVGLVTLFGLRGAWTTPLVVLLVLLAAFGPILGRVLFGLGAATEEPSDLLRAVGEVGWTTLAACGVILLAGLLSFLGLGGRWTMGAAGVGLGLLVLGVTGRLALEGLATPDAPHPFFAALGRAALWLGPLAGAFLAPLAAAVVDP